MVSMPENHLNQLLNGLEVLEPMEASGLQVFGLRRLEEPGGISYLTMDDALESKLLDVSEVDEQGSVPDMKVENKSDSMVFFMAGEQLVGAKQNRVLNVSLMVGAGKELTVPVSCVEAGRWAYRSRRFSSGRTSSHSHLRAKMSKFSTDSYRARGKPSSRQGEVWEEVSRKLAEMKSSSDTAALDQIYRDSECRLQKILDQLPPPRKCAGAVFAFGGRIVGMDIFDRSHTLEKLWKKLIQTYAIDALGESRTGTPLARRQVESWLESLPETLRSEEHNSPGLGSDIRMESESLVGGCLLVEDQPIHAEIFTLQKE